MNSIQNLSDLFRRRIALEDELKQIDERLAELLPADKPTWKIKPRKEAPKSKPARKPVKTKSRKAKHPQEDIAKEVKRLAQKGFTGHEIMEELKLCSNAFYGSYNDIFKANSALAKSSKHQGTKKGQSKYSRTGREANKLLEPYRPVSSAAHAYKCDCGAQFESIWDVNAGDSVYCPECNAKIMPTREPKSRWTGTHISHGLKKPIEPVNYKCQECSETFDSDLPKIDVACPYCSSVHVETN